MRDIPQKELRNQVGEVLRRVEAGETLTVTVSGRPVAELGPVLRRRLTLAAAPTGATPTSVAFHFSKRAVPPIVGTATIGPIGGTHAPG